MALTNKDLETAERAAQDFLAAAANLRACLEENLGFSYTATKRVADTTEALKAALNDLEDNKR
jgi:hypothetical protein